MYNNYGDLGGATVSSPVRPSPIFFAIVAATVAGAWLTTTDVIDPGIAVFIFVIAGWILSLSLHEFAHAYFAWRSGDHSVQQRGYLTLDPRRYTNPVLSILLPVVFLAMGGIGLPGGAVLIDRSKLNDNQAIKVALAGPLTNLVFAVASLAVVGFGVVTFEAQPYLTAALSVFGFLQAFVFVLNMMPVPGLDGYAAIEPTLPASFQELMRPVRQFGLMLLILLLWSDNPIRQAMFDAVYAIVDLFDINQRPAEFVGLGFNLLQFWR